CLITCILNSTILVLLMDFMVSTEYLAQIEPKSYALSTIVLDETVELEVRGCRPFESLEQVQSLTLPSPFNIWLQQALTPLGPPGAIQDLNLKDKFMVEPKLALSKNNLSSM
ncbi:MAG: hypothetical protein AAF512_25545, partial [Pseudomonadota bacterium]